MTSNLGLIVGIGTTVPRKHIFPLTSYFTIKLISSDTDRKLNGNVFEKYIDERT